MKTITQKGGLKGNFTNHSGKRTCATQLYMNGVSEQEIMRRTGHRCEKSVRKYKRSSEQIEMDVSKILDPPMNEPACDTDPPRKKIKSENFPCENILHDLTNSNKAVFANCNFNISIGN